MALATALLCLLALSGSSNAGMLHGMSRSARSNAEDQKASDPGKHSDFDLSTEDVLRSKFEAKDFLFDFSAAASTPFGSVRGEGVNNRPALATLPQEGGSQALVTLEACAINQPHSHPRGTELAYVTKGSLYFGVIEENLSAATKTGGRFLGSEVPAGTTFVIPQGLIHYAINRSCNQTQFLASFPTRDAGTQTTLSSLFKDEVTTDVLRATTGLTDDDIEVIRKKVKANSNPSADPECLKRCKAQPYY